jgi:hypothetical protein
MPHKDPHVTSAPEPSIEPTRPSSALKDNLSSIAFMATLLLVSAVTAKIVGFKIKTADRQRDGELLAAYDALRPAPLVQETSESPVFSPSLSKQQQAFVSVFEINQAAMQRYLYSALEQMPPAEIEAAIEGSLIMGAKEASMTLREISEALKDKSGANGAMNLTAARLAKRYDRSLARDTETKLYKYLTDNRALIAPSNGSPK